MNEYLSSYWTSSGQHSTNCRFLRGLLFDASRWRNSNYRWNPNRNRCMFRY